MDTSTPPDDPPASDAREDVLDTLVAQIAAIDTIVDLAQQRLCVFDIDLSEMGWGSAARTDRLAAFLRRSRHARVEIIVHDTRWLETSGARLVAVQRLHATAVTIYRTGSEARHARDPLVIADGRHALHRFHVDHPRASLVLDRPTLVRPLQMRFDEIWVTGEPGLTATTLGLVVRGDDRAVVRGIVALHSLDTRPEVGFWLGRPFWGHGLMSEAVDASLAWAYASLDVDTIAAGAFRGNVASLAIQARQGFEVVGMSQRPSLIEDRLLDHVDTQLTRTRHAARPWRR